MLPDHMSASSKQELLQRFLDWARSQPDIRAVALVGSAVRVDRPADEWSDYDLIVVASDPGIYLTSTEWLAQIGSSWCSILETAPTGQPVERRVLFEGGFDIDFIILSIDDARQGFENMPMIAEISQRGRKVLWDKDGILPEIPASPGTAPAAQQPTGELFLEVVNDFWFHVAWTAKKLRRGELWSAKKCCDTYLKDLLLQMIEWEAQAANGWKLDTWFNGRFLEHWALPQTMEELHQVFAGYKTEDVWRALEATTKMFRRIAQETAVHLGCVHPVELDQQVSAWVSSIHTDDGLSG